LYRYYGGVLCTAGYRTPVQKPNIPHTLRTYIRLAHLPRVYFGGVHLGDVHPRGVHLTGVYLKGVYLTHGHIPHMDMYLRHGREPQTWPCTSSMGVSLKHRHILYRRTPYISHMGVFLARPYISHMVVRLTYRRTSHTWPYISHIGVHLIGVHLIGVYLMDVQYISHISVYLIGVQDVRTSARYAGFLIFDFRRNFCFCTEIPIPYRKFRT
jgi:hypothetical protein